MSSASPEKDHALGLTVHSMPESEQIAAAPGARTRIGRLKMLLVFLMCAAPVAASYFTYYVVRPEGRRNFGALIDPQRPTPPMQAQALNGGTLNLQSLKGQWLLVSVASGSCDDACAHHLYLQRQLRESLGKEKDRLDWVWLVNDEAPVAEALRPALKGATVLRVPASELAQWLQSESGHALPDHLYVVDPMGNWMMRFPAGLDLNTAANAKRDLTRLLSASASWDNAGR